jgi:hypothetical protein
VAKHVRLGAPLVEHRVEGEGEGVLPTPHAHDTGAVHGAAQGMVGGAAKGRRCPVQAISKCIPCVRPQLTSAHLDPLAALVGAPGAGPTSTHRLAAPAASWGSNGRTRTHTNTSDTEGGAPRRAPPSPSPSPSRPGSIAASRPSGPSQGPSSSPGLCPASSHGSSASSKTGRGRECAAQHVTLVKLGRNPRVCPRNDALLGTSPGAGSSPAPAVSEPRTMYCAWGRSLWCTGRVAPRLQLGDKEGGG